LSDYCRISFSKGKAWEEISNKISGSYFNAIGVFEPKSWSSKTDPAMTDLLTSIIGYLGSELPGCLLLSIVQNTHFQEFNKKLKRRVSGFLYQEVKIIELLMMEIYDLGKGKFKPDNLFKIILKYDLVSKIGCEEIKSNLRRDRIAKKWDLLNMLEMDHLKLRLPNSYLGIINELNNIRKYH